LDSLEAKLQLSRRCPSTIGGNQRWLGSNVCQIRTNRTQVDYVLRYL